MKNYDEQSHDEFLDEFCFIANDEEENIEEDLQSTFESKYKLSLYVWKIRN